VYQIVPIATESQIQALESFLGEERIESDLAQYSAFRKRHSPADVWSHRHPTSSPLVPLLYRYHHSDEAGKDIVPYGHWYGDPIQNLRQVVTALYLLNDYWSLIPRQLMADNVKSRFSTGDRLHGFMHELLVAADSRQRFKDYVVHPLFLDPETVFGKPSVVLRKGSDEIAVHCKTVNPLSVQGLTFDVLQYLFGCFYRLVQDSGYCYRLTLNLKRKPQIADIDALLGRLRSSIDHGSELHKDVRDPVFDVELLTLEMPDEGLSLTEMNGLLAKDAGDLFVEIGGSNPAGEKKATRVAVLSVSAGGKKSFDDHIVDEVRETMKEAGTKLPVILALHLHRYVGWGEYLGNSSLRVRLRQRLDGILGDYPNVQYVFVSSNRQEYVTLPSDAQRVDTKDLEISNRYFERQPGRAIWT